VHFDQTGKTLPLLESSPWTNHPVDQPSGLAIHLDTVIDRKINLEAVIDRKIKMIQVDRLTAINDCKSTIQDDQRCSKHGQRSKMINVI